VHWYGVPPVKSLFFSIVACLRNFGAYLVYGITWLGVFLLSGVVITTLTGLLGSPELAAAIMLPTALLMAAMFFTSVFFTFRDTFVPPHHNAEGQGFSSLA
jgi:cell division protein FtsW (lipid II flippase)